ncbi:hypothetical protein [Lactococcus paracarnosus]|uniref:hypothetical protein n=1 Tax=Pseudolactococcus paracarnosus TaxID=2749962 RepID=UPI000D4D7245|nr:hypothetical protein LPICM02_140017 [Lactococcus piscium]
MIQLYCINITKDFSYVKIHDLLHYVSSERKERFHKFHFLKDSLGSLYGEILVRYISTTLFNLNNHQIFLLKTNTVNHI